MYAAETDQFQIIEDLISSFIDVDVEGDGLHMVRKARVNVNLLDEVFFTKVGFGMIIFIVCEDSFDIGMY